jgi:hypothetical protein
MSPFFLPELATVKFFPVVQGEISTKTGEWGTLSPPN